MFVGREYYRYTETLSRLLSEQTIQARASRNWLQPWLKAYVWFFGIPDVGFQLRARYFRSFVQWFNFSRALDAGCGLGLNSFYLAQKCPSATIDACDIDADLVKMAKTILADLRQGNVNVFQMDLTRLAEVNKYDLIFCIDVIEHIPDDLRVLSSFNRALKDGGILFLSTNHKRHTERRLKGLKYESHGHVRGGYTDQELEELLRNSGFLVTEIRKVWGFWGEYSEELYHWISSRLPAPFSAVTFPVLALVSLLDMLARNPEGYGLIVQAQKRADTELKSQIP